MCFCSIVHLLLTRCSKRKHITAYDIKLLIQEDIIFKNLFNSPSHHDVIISTITNSLQPNMAP